ncbi:two-component system, chemotaxis family, response regulator CheY [Quadrisphaera granulorum]|uniref:Two-component system chemotaxis response regulator CheY n=1 Tax=Quadrisphaera granulorum TaxID=317664 RepID=A0A316AD79_9ACTN|nr:response regulator [Quadrisphaera granulorum]PWJ55693.1 two-component system chemotaxis response regulator CheY [Quadrisphaera granulorum]SZE95190.1 two-component system, chemotaxis family, response regulator CheY [Quadrisphaera granulorum]
MKTVLLIDDSPTMLMSVKSMLTKGGLGVETAADGQEALDRVKGGLKPDLVISDVNMPRLDGISFVREARKAGLRFTPILMLTTESEQTKRDAAKTAGATGWLVKPIQADALLAVVRQVVPGA